MPVLGVVQVVEHLVESAYSGDGSDHLDVYVLDVVCHVPTMPARADTPGDADFGSNNLSMSEAGSTLIEQSQVALGG
jgi:hypothetical protein